MLVFIFIHFQPRQVFPFAVPVSFDLEPTTHGAKDLVKYQRTLIIFGILDLTLPNRKLLRVFVLGDNTPARRKTHQLSSKLYRFYQANTPYLQSKKTSAI